MPTNVIMPQMGESVAEGTVVKWLKKVGDPVERDEPLLEISTDKVDAEIPSPAAGILAKILVKENETVAVNTVVAVLDGEGEAAEAPGAAAEKPSTPPVSEAKPTPPPSASGPAPAPAPPVAHPGGPVVHGEGKVRSSPLVRRIAAERGVDLARVRGTGLGGRVSKKDILAYLTSQAESPAVPVVPAPAGSPSGVPLVPPRAGIPAASAGPTPPIVFTGPTLVVPMTPMRKQIAEHMLASRRTSAHVSTVFEAEMTRVVDLRKRHAEEFERRNGIKLTYTPFLVRATVEAIKEFPILNSSVEGSNIVYQRDINIGVAVALETGLIVPVIKHADEKNFLGVARAVQELAERARTKRLSVDDVQGGTFTITNPGVFGSLFGTPIINQPQVAILGVGAIEKRAVVRDDAIAIRSMVYLALSFDHRIIDGAVADRFMARVKHRLEHWDEAVL
ncbi:MAG TPA: dihydrolipoamide acetyltransferase family protein [Terriglobia bacterium]|nr:dihydrolipoamide acetyltransferase family protein [Terriglobia bacterium]